MKTLDEVIDYCEGKQNCGEWVGIADALHYLKAFRDAKDTLEAEKDRYSEAVRNCEQAENKFRKMEDELNDIRREHIEQMKNDPLTWDDLCRLEMIGEPVWNSNTLRWMLIIDNASDGTWIDLVNHAGGHEKWIEHDLRKNPLYRKER